MSAIDHTLVQIALATKKQRKLHLPEYELVKLLEPIDEAKSRLNAANKALENEADALRVKVQNLVESKKVPWSHRYIYPWISGCINSFAFSDTIKYLCFLSKAGKKLRALERKGNLIIIAFPLQIIESGLLGIRRARTCYKIYMGISNGDITVSQDGAIEIPFKSYIGYGTNIGEQYLVHDSLRIDDSIIADAFWGSIAGSNLVNYNSYVFAGSDRNCRKFMEGLFLSLQLSPEAYERAVRTLRGKKASKAKKVNNKKRLKK